MHSSIKKLTKCCVSAFSLAFLVNSTTTALAKDLLSSSYIEQVYKNTQQTYNNYKSTKQQSNTSVLQQLIASGKNKAEDIEETKFQQAVEEELAKEEIIKIPYFAQDDPRWGSTRYPYKWGGYNTMAASACGPTSFAMVASYLSDTLIYPNEVLLDGRYHVGGGTENKYFAAAAEEFNIGEVVETDSWEDVVEALENGQMVISIQNYRGPFTDNGHFIVLRDIDEDGDIYVHDPNGGHSSFSDRSFTPREILVGSSGRFWIFEKKEDLRRRQIEERLLAERNAEEEKEKEEKDSDNVE